MFIHEIGNRDNPTIILMAPMMVSGEELYSLMSPHLTGEYHVISPDQGGHGHAGRYVSADQEYKELKKFLLESGCTHIHLLYGASLGVAVAYRLFLDSDFTVSHAWFDGVALSKSAGFAEWFMKKLFRNRKKKMKRMHTEASLSLVKMYGHDFAKMMTKNFKQITIPDIDAMCHACCHYDLKKLTDAEQKKLHLDFGEKDFDWTYSRKTIPVYMPNAEVTIRPGYPHCGYMAAETAEYVKQIEEFMKA